jgi:hypothetical protein
MSIGISEKQPSKCGIGIIKNTCRRIPASHQNKTGTLEHRRK